MSVSGSKSLPPLGFLTVVHQAELGVFGGLLMLNELGRPVEFHCTAPVRPNRAQEILYGPTLQPFVYGEQIGLTLLEHTKTAPAAILTDATPVLALRRHAELPVIWVGDRSPESDADAGTSFTIEGRHAATARNHESDQGRFLRDWMGYREHIDLVEPFSRIREAIEEAQRGAKAA